MTEPPSTARRDRQVVAAIIVAVAAVMAAVIEGASNVIDWDKLPSPTLSVTSTPGPSKSPTAVPSPVQLTITSPQNGDTVQASNDIHIKLSGTLPSGQEVWAVVDSLEDGRRYPQGACQLSSEGKAFCTGRFGKLSQESVGRLYKITAVIIGSTDAPILAPFKDGGYPTTGPVPVRLLVQSPAITVERV